MGLPPRLRLVRSEDSARPVAVHCALRIVCDQQAEETVRELCVGMFARINVPLDSRYVIDPSGTTTVLVEIGLAAGGSTTAVLERLVVQLTREPGVRNVSWRMDMDTEDFPAADPPTGRSGP
ncbi:hypothetical protein ACFC0M_30740 [Streptomyces sp. NPDC056149]|uniref:hypothetical protein n=1 Tax=Streptomyces sp. NPDC056149 TaxID=3345728 RepID=UPI0035DA62F5